jgi:hypothetical protein
MYLRESYPIDSSGYRHAGNPVGCVAIKLNSSGTRVSYQVSVLNPRDRFSRTVARQLALGRLTEAPFTVVLANSPTMYDITLAVMTDILRDRGQVMRARKAARQWLENNTF